MKEEKENDILKTHTVIDEKVRCNHHFCDYDGLAIKELQNLLESEKSNAEFRSINSSVRDSKSSKKKRV